MANNDDEKFTLADQTFHNSHQRPTEVSKEELLPIINSQKSISSELKHLRAEVASIATENSSSQSVILTKVPVVHQADSPASQKLKANESVLSDVESHGTIIDSSACPKIEAVLTKISHLEDRWSKNDENICKILSRCNSVEQYGRLYNLIIDDVLGVPYRLKGIPFSRFVVRLLNSLLGRYLCNPICLNDIDKSHPLFKKSNGKYVLIVRFVRRDVRDDIFYKVKHIPKGSGITITENLTADNRKLFNSAIQTLGRNNVFTDQCKIYAHVNGKKIHIENESDIAKLLDSIISVPVDKSESSPQSSSSSSTSTNKLSNKLSNNKFSKRSHSTTYYSRNTDYWKMPLVQTQGYGADKNDSTSYMTRNNNFNYDLTYYTPYDNCNQLEDYYYQNQGGVL